MTAKEKNYIATDKTGALCKGILNSFSVESMIIERKSYLKIIPVCFVE